MSATTKDTGCPVCRNSIFTDLQGIKAQPARRGLLGIQHWLFGYCVETPARIRACCSTCWAYSEFIASEVVVRDISIGGKRQATFSPEANR